MDDRIHNCFPDCDHRIGPDLGPLHGSNDGLAGHMFLQEGDHFFGRTGKIRAYLGGIHDPAPVITGESAGLYPCVWIAVQPVGAKEKNAADGRHNPSLVRRHQPQSLQFMPSQFADRSKVLGSSSEVDGFRVQFRDRLLVQGRHLAETPHFLDQNGVGAPVRRAYPNEDTLFRPEAVEMVWTAGTRINLDSQDMGLPPGDDLDGRDQFGGDVVSDEVRQTFLLLQDVRDALDSSCAVLDSNKKSASGGVGEGDYGL